MEIKAINFQSCDQLSVLQFESHAKNTLEHISLSKAVKNNFLEIKEVSESGDVNNLIAMNTSDKFIFMMDGDILQGAKQNRVLNASVLLAPKTKIKMPVSCVEQGRWRHVSAKFSSADYSAPSRMRAKKSMRVTDNLETYNEHASNQGEVWDDVRLYSKLFSVDSATSNLSDIHETKQDFFEKFEKSFKPEKEANGLAVFIRKNLLAVDIFNRTDIHGEYFAKLIKGAAFEAANLKHSDQIPDEKEAYYKTISMLDLLDENEYKEYNGIGVGVERRYNSNKVSGAELSFQNKLVHLSLINLN